VAWSVVERFGVKRQSIRPVAKIADTSSGESIVKAIVVVRIHSRSRWFPGHHFQSVVGTGDTSTSKTQVQRAGHGTPPEQRVWRLRRSLDVQKAARRGAFRCTKCSGRLFPD
jgi:hypothetical protein